MPTQSTLSNAIRALSMDAVQQANSGHPGMPMGMADIATVLWRKFLNHNPFNPDWLNRDRFILSNGHGSMLHYALLHLSGYDVNIEDIKNFRQLHSKTPGHPEYGYTPGVETTTGPLGQGIANGVGMAIAERALSATFNQPNFDLINHYTYVFMGDGCLMEGISHEACSLAGTLKLGKLIAFWDDNGISIDGEVSKWFSDQTPERFRAYGWQVIENINGHDQDAIEKAILEAQKETTQPTLICCRTEIGFGSPNKAGKASSHGAPLGTDEIIASKAQLSWTHDTFEIPEEIYQAWSAKEIGSQKQTEWDILFAEYQKTHPELAKELTRRTSGELPQDWQAQCQKWLEEAVEAKQSVASRKASALVLDQFGPKLSELLGGSADLTGSNLTKWQGSTELNADNPNGSYLYYGVREFGMTAIMNGLALYGGFIPYGGTFLVFSDYARNAMRMAALMKTRAIYVLTHDSIGLGEDGPTHQPVEHTASLRLIPNLNVWRPCDHVETTVAWQSAVEAKDAPTALILSRQTLPAQAHTVASAKEIHKGGYILKENDMAALTLVATGSEVQLAVESAALLDQIGVQTRVVSMPCVEIFESQSDDYKTSVLPTNTPIIAIEAGVDTTWYRYVGHQGKVIGMNTFGESAPAGDLFKHFNFTVEHVVETAKQLMEK